MTPEEALDHLFKIPGEADFMDPWVATQILNRYRRDEDLMKAGRALGHLVPQGSPSAGYTPPNTHRVTHSFLTILNAGFRDLIIEAAKTKNELLS